VDHIARSVFFAGASVQRKDSCVRNQKLLRTFVQNIFLISEADLLILVKYIENRRKIWNIQTKFCWIRSENTTTFVKHDPTFE
jgi:hypothetical protein